MMGQFIVTGNNTTDISEITNEESRFSLYPNPANEKLFVKLKEEFEGIYYLRLTNAIGRTILMLPRPQIENGIDISTLKPGVYFVQVTDEKTLKTTTEKFIKQ